MSERPFCVLNPGGRDAEQEFLEGAGSREAPGHAPINYHAYAACMRGGFYRKVENVPPGTRGVLVLLRKRNLRRALQAIMKLKARGVRGWISLKESGSHQVADFLNDVTRVTLFGDACRMADGYISSTRNLTALYRMAGCVRGSFIPTPYPVESEAWNFAVPVAERRGIFVGTREPGVPSRRHVEAVLLADRLSRKLEIPVAVMNDGTRRGGMLLKAIRGDNPYLHIIEGPLPYARYLKLMAVHRIVWQLDASDVPGQVAGDALLCRVPCVGGNGAVERIAFPDLCGQGRSPEELFELAGTLLVDDLAYAGAMDRSQALAGDALSFGAIRRRIEELLLA